MEFADSVGVAGLLGGTMDARQRLSGAGAEPVSLFLLHSEITRLVALATMAYQGIDPDNAVFALLRHFAHGETSVSDVRSKTLSW